MSKIDTKQIIYINSADRISGTDGNFLYPINLQSGNNYDMICALSVTIPKSWYSSQSGYNYFTLSENGLSARITLPVGNYTRTSFSTVLSSSLTSGSPRGYTYVVSFPNVNSAADTGLYTFTVSGNGGVQPTISFDNISFINDLMGFGKASTNSFSGNILTSSQVVNLQPFSVVNVHCDLVSDRGSLNINSQILQSVFANVGSVPYSNIGWLCPDFEAFSHTLASNSVGSLNIYLTDQDGIPIDLNGVNMQLELMFYKKNDAQIKMSTFIPHLTKLLMNLFPSLY